MQRVSRSVPTRFFCNTSARYGPLSILLGNAVSMLLRSACCLAIFPSVFDPLHPQLKHVVLRIATGAAASRLVMFALPQHWFLVLFPPSSPLRASITQCCVVGGVALLTLLAVRQPFQHALASVKAREA